MAMKMKTVLLSSVMALPLLACADLAKMSLDGTWDFSFARGVELPAAKVDFAESFYMICTSLRQRVQDPNVEFIYENPFDHLYVVMDVNRIHQVVTNFLTNAVKYTHSGHIKLAYERRDGGLYIYCEDTGAGIPAEDQ